MKTPLARGVPYRPPYAGVITSIGIILTVAYSVGIITTATRITQSFTRDYGLPLSRFLIKVDKRTKVPIVTCAIVYGLAYTLSLIYIGSTTAFNNIVLLTVTSFYYTYLLPSARLLYHRIKGNILQHSILFEGVASTIGPLTPINSRLKPTIVVPSIRSASATDTPSTDASDKQPRSIEDRIADTPLVWGPQHVSGILGTINNTYACAYICFVLFQSAQPPDILVNYTTMNYSIVVT